MPANIQKKVYNQQTNLTTNNSLFDFNKREVANDAQ